MRKQEACARAMGVVVAAWGMAALLGGCATTEGSSAASLAPPKNWREQVAAKLREMEDASVIQYVGTTQPKQMWTGIQNGGTRPAVCVKMEKPNIFGARAAWYFTFYFENGKVDGHKMQTVGPALQPLFQCEPPLTTITDLVRLRS
ncbi:MAG TPA: hypothetical protein VG758_04970 [Hyphomicrobiaceae bacterium]|jgi:hypothetical protein|nr:hypothetical protein [Hyphomicrobiaceae bacterium]